MNSILPLPPIDILSGHILPMEEFRRVFCEYKHMLWIAENDFHSLQDDSSLLCDHVSILPYEKPLTVKIVGGKVTHFFNIIQVSHPWSIFCYYLYHRQFSQNRKAFRFETQKALHSHAVANAFQSNYWVNGKYFRQDIAPLELKPNAQSVNVLDAKCPMYNIDQTSDPIAAKRMIESRPCNVFTGNFIFSTLKKPLVNACFTTNFWFEKRHLLELTKHKVSLLPLAKPTLVENGRYAVEFYNTQQTTDPLALQKVYHDIIHVRESCVELFTKRTLPFLDANKLFQKKCERNFTSQFWVNEDNIERLGVVIKPEEKNEFVKCFTGVWYNLDQVDNPLDVVRRKYGIVESMKNIGMGDIASNTHAGDKFGF